jgi:dTMP kinase
MTPRPFLIYGKRGLLELCCTPESGLDPGHASIRSRSHSLPLRRGALRNVSPSSLSSSASYAKLPVHSMPERGKFIVLEGIDGSGKRTQLDMLARALTERKVTLSQVSFPRYEGFFGKLVAQFLNGDFGALDAVDAHFSALLYAGDRYEAKPKIVADLAAGSTVLADRYIGSNLAHQGARVPRETRDEFLRWLKRLEYEIYALPAEDLVVYLRVPVAEAHRLVGQKGVREYTRLERDILESNLAHLEAAAEVYDQLARQPNWVKIECFDANAGTLRAPVAIHAEILAAIGSRILKLQGAPR